MLDMITIRLLDHVLFAGSTRVWGPGLALVGMSIVEQRYQAVLAVLAGDPVMEVAAKVGVSRQSVHTWLRRYAEEGLAGLQDRSRRPDGCAHQAAPEVEALVCEMRRHHPKWGSRRIVFELGRHGCPGEVPSRMTVYRILIRHGLMTRLDAAGAARTMSGGNGTGRWSCGRWTSSAGSSCPTGRRPRW